MSGIGCFFHVAMSCCDDANVCLNGFAATDALKCLFLQDSQHFALQRQWHVADFVKKQRPSVALFKLADAAAVGAGECPLFMTEQFTFEEVFRNCRAVHRENWAFVAAAVLVDGPCDEFLSRSAFAANQDSDVLWGDASDCLVNFLHGRATTNHNVA